MATFRYEGYDQLGKAKRGTVEAGDQSAALTGLRSQGVNPTRVEPVLAAPLPARTDGFRLQPGEARAPEVAIPAPRPRAAVPHVEENFGHAAEQSFPGTSSSRPNPGTSAPMLLPRQPLLRTNSKFLALWYRNLASLVDAGTGLGAALESMAQAAPTPALRSASRQMSSRVMTGAQLSDLMPSFPGLFPPLHFGITAAGERGGFLVASFERLANYCERDYELQTNVKRETWYPKLVAVCGIFIPSIVTLVLQGPQAWFSSMIPVMMRIAFFVALWIGWQFARPFIPLDNPVKAFWDRVRLYMPMVGKVVRGLATAKFCRAYGALYSAGVGPGEAIRLSSLACGNLAIGRDAVAQIPQVERGLQLTEALRATHHFPPLALQMLQIGEQTGDLDTQLDKAANFLESDAETAVKQAVPVIGILMFLFVAFFLVLPQLIGLINGISNIYDNAGNPDAK